MKLKLSAFFILCSLMISPLSLKVYSDAVEYSLLEQDYFLEKGIESFSNNQFKEALSYFDMVLQVAHEKSVYYGSALWGKAFCHACLEDSSLLEEDLLTITDYILPLNSCKDCREALITYKPGENLEILQVAYFAEDSFPISIDECKKRVYGTFNSITAVLEKKLPTAADSFTRERFKYFAAQLAAKGYKCCDAGTHWTECVKPLTDRWKAWKDRDLPPNPE